MGRRRASGGPGSGLAGLLAPGDAPRPDATLNAVGLFCPVPIIRTTARVRRMQPGEVLEVRADDPVTRVDLPNWCRGAGHVFLGWYQANDELRLFIQVGKPRLSSRGPGENDGS